MNEVTVVRFDSHVQVIVFMVSNIAITYATRNVK